ncbi:MAG: hypothetical protein PVG27_01120 [Chloroflexota bacterium]|jgi:hypothetical protein
MTAQGSVDELDLLLVDGDNLLHDVRGTRDEGGVAWLLPRLSGWRPEHLRIVVALDGHPAPGETTRRQVARGIEFHHSGSRSADDLLIDRLTAQPYVGRSRTAVVTHDRSLRARANRAGGVTRSVDWLVRQLAGVGDKHRGSTRAADKPVGIGQGRPRRRHLAAPDAEEERGTWQPGRGATRKKGNPRRRAKRARRR